MSLMYAISQLSPFLESQNWGGNWKSGNFIGADGKWHFLLPKCKIYSYLVIGPHLLGNYRTSHAHSNACLLNWQKLEKHFCILCTRVMKSLEIYCRGVYGLRLRSSIFCCRTCVYSKIFLDIPLVGPNAILKKSNNIVNSSPRVFVFSGILVPKDSFQFIWSRDQDRFWFGR